MKYTVIKEYNDIPESPISIEKDEILEFVEESNPNGDWANWIYCRTDEKEGWVPKQILKLKNDKVVCLEDYIATEHILRVGEEIISERELNGWVWGYKSNDSTKYGWAPLNHLERM